MVHVYKSEDTKHECEKKKWNSWREKCCEELALIAEEYHADFKVFPDARIRCGIVKREFPRCGLLGHIIPHKWEQVATIYFLNDSETIVMKGEFSWIRKFAETVENMSTLVKYVQIDDTGCT